jgi:hypothetical protein
MEERRNKIHLKPIVATPNPKAQVMQLYPHSPPLGFSSFP